MALPCIIRAASEGKGRTGPTLAQSARISNRARAAAADEVVISPDAVDKSWTPSYLSADLPAPLLRHWQLRFGSPEKRNNVKALGERLGVAEASVHHSSGPERNLRHVRRGSPQIFRNRQ